MNYACNHKHICTQRNKTFYVQFTSEVSCNTERTVFIKCKTMKFDIYVQLIVNKNTLVYIFEN